MKKKAIILAFVTGIIAINLLLVPRKRNTLSPEQVFRSTLQNPIPASITNIQVHSIFLPTMGDGGALFQFEISPSDFDDLVKQNGFEKKEITEWTKKRRLFTNPEYNLVNPEYFTSESQSSINRLQMKVDETHTKVIVDFNGFFNKN